MDISNPTLNINIEDVAAVPIVEGLPPRAVADECLASTRTDWNAYERSWDFQPDGLHRAHADPRIQLQRLDRPEPRHHRRDEASRRGEQPPIYRRLRPDGRVTPDVPIEQITLTVNPAYRYGSKLNEEEQWTRFRQDTMEELVSYAIGCMMGRYSLDKPGLFWLTPVPIRTST